MMKRFSQILTAYEIIYNYLTTIYKSFSPLRFKMFGLAVGFRITNSAVAAYFLQ